MKILSTIIILLFPLTLLCQTLPYAELPVYSDEYSAGKVAARAVDGLGFRFHWATDELRETDLAFKPGPEARTSLETAAHIYEMSFIILNAVKKKVNVDGQDAKVPFPEMRKKTLENLKAASDVLMKSTDAEMKNYKALFNRNGKTVEIPFWNIINGPIEDCVWHVGQIVSFRRSSGNPINEKVNVFMGTVRK